MRLLTGTRLFRASNAPTRISKDQNNTVARGLPNCEPPDASTRSHPRWATGVIPRGTTGTHPMLPLRSMASGSGTHQPAEGSNAAVDVLLVIVDVRADAQASDPGRDVDLLRGQPLDQAVRHAARKPQAQDMRRAHRGVGNAYTAIAQRARQPRGERAEPRRDRIAAPLRDQLHSDRCHLQRDEMIALAHVEAARACDEFDVAVVGLALGGDGAAAVAGLLERHAVLAALGDVEEGAPVGPE